MGATQINKYAWLIQQLSYGEKSLQEIIRAWGNRDGRGLSRRTFINWKNTLEDRFRIKVEHRNVGREYFYHIGMRPGEDNIADWLLQTLSIENTLMSATDISDRIILESIPSSESNLQPVLDAIKDNRCIAFTYTDYWEDTVAVTIKPYFVKLFRQRWHVIGPLVNPKADDGPIKSYALDSDRLSNLKILDMKFKYPEDFNPQDFFYNNYSTLIDDKTKNPATTIKVLVWEKQNFYFRSVPLHHSQNEIYTSETDGYSIFEYYLQPTLDFIMDLRSFGNYVEVLEPQSLRDIMIQDARDVIDEYAGASRKSCKEDIPFIE